MNANCELMSDDIQHLLEVDCVPDALSYFLRSVSKRADRWEIKRMGELRSTRYHNASTIGDHWRNLAFELFDSSDESKVREIYHEQFFGAKGLRVLRIEGGVETTVLDEFRPDILFINKSDVLPKGYGSFNFKLFGVQYEVCSSSKEARELFLFFLRKFDENQVALLAMRDFVAEVPDLVLWDGFHAPENEGRDSWAWTGVSKISRIIMPRILSQKLLLSIYVYGNLVDLSSDNFAVSVNGIFTPHMYLPNLHQLQLYIDHAEGDPILLISLHHNSLCSASDGSRELGVAIKALKLEGSI